MIILGALIPSVFKGCFPQTITISFDLDCREDGEISDEDAANAVPVPKAAPDA